MKIAIAGGSGFIGSHIANVLSERSHEVVVWDLTPPKNSAPFVRINLTKEEPSRELFSEVDGVINLIGKSIFGRWTNEFKKELYDSRIQSTRNLVSAMASLDRKPSVFISASAVGYYGDRGDEILTERSLAGTDFLASLATDWESEAMKANTLGIRTVTVRTALVLGEKGLLQQLLPLFSKGLGGPIGNGSQWMPWIHIADIARIYAFCVEHSSLNGPVIAAAPHSIQNREFAAILRATLHRPAFFRIPVWMLRLLYNDFANAIVASQRVSPEKLTAEQYQFTFPTLSVALEHLLRQP